MGSLWRSLMAERGRSFTRDPRGTDLRISFSAGQNWNVGENSESLAVMANAYPNIGGGVQICKGYQSLKTDDFDGGLGAGTNGATSFAQDGKRNYAFDLHNEQIAIFRPGATNVAIFKKTNHSTYTALSYNMRGIISTYAKSLNDYSREPLAWSNRTQTTEIQGWIVHGKPVIDPYYQSINKLRSAFTVGTASKKGDAEDYYDPGRIMPMVEAGFYTDNTNPKISFHGVPVPIISGQHKELPFGAPFGKGIVVNGNAIASGGGLHFAASGTALYGDTVNATTGSVSSITPSPTQRFFVATENTLDITGPNLHMFVAPHANDEGDPYDNDADQVLLWSIKSQDGGVDQEYSTTRHFNSGVTNIDDIRDGSSSGSGTAAGDKIWWNSPHPVSVDFDEHNNKGDMYMAYHTINGSNYSVIVKKYTKNATTGVYTQARTISLETHTNKLFLGGIKLICAPPDTTFASGCLWVCVQNNFDRDATRDESQIRIFKIDMSTTWTDSAGPPTPVIERNIRIGNSELISWFSVDVMENCNNNQDNSLVITASCQSTAKNLYIWHQDSLSLNTPNTTVTASVNQMTELTSAHGFEHTVSRIVPPLMKCFKYNGKNMIGALAFIDDAGDSLDKWYAWTGQYDDEKFSSNQTDFSPSSAKGHLYNNTGDTTLTDFTGKVASSNNIIDSDTSYANQIYGYHGDLQGRFHYKYPFFNRWNIRKESTEANDNDSYVGRVSFNFKSGKFDAWNPSYGEDSDGVNDRQYAEQAGCREGVLGDSNGLIPTRLGQFLNNSGNWDDYDHGGITDSFNGASCMFPTTRNGNCSLMYPAYTRDHAVTFHQVSNPKKMDMVIHGTIYGGSEDKGHTYLKDVKEGQGSSYRLTYRPYPSNNLWCGSNMNPLTPIVNLPEGESNASWHPKTDTHKKPILAGLDINMIDRVTTTSGDISPGKYRYKIAFAKSGSNENYKNTGAEGNVFSHDKFDAFFEMDLTESKANRGVQLHFNKPLLEGRTVFTCQADPNTSGTDYIKVKVSMAAAGYGAFGNRLIGKDTGDEEDGWYTHFDHYSSVDVLTNPYLSASFNNTANKSLKYYWALEDDGTVNTSKAVYVEYAGNGGTGVMSSDSNPGRAGNVGGVGGGSSANYDALHLVDSAGTDLDMSHSDWSWIKASTETHLARSLKQGNDTELDAAVGGGLIHFGPGQDRAKPYLKYIIIYRTGDVSKASTDKEAYFKVGEVDLVDDVDWTDVTSPITFLDTVDTTFMSSEEANYLNSMMPVDGDNITAMAASGNRLWVAYNDTFTSTADKHKLPSTLIYSDRHWEYLSPLNTVIVDDNVVIHSLKDFNGALWIFTDRGTYVIPDSHSDPTQSNFRILRKDDFIIHQHPQDSERFLRIKGQIYVLGQDGVYLHDPNPNSRKNFEKISGAVGDFFKGYNEEAMGLYHNKDEESIICYIKQVASFDNIKNKQTLDESIFTINYHLPTRSWWSYGGMESGEDAWWSQMDDVISVIGDANPASATAKYANVASGEYDYSNITLAIRDFPTASLKKKCEVMRVGHRYGPFDNIGSAEELGTQDVVLQTSWIGDSDVERYWDQIEVDYHPAIYMGSNTSLNAHLQFKIYIDTLNPWAKDSDDSLTDETAGNSTPVSKGAQLSASTTINTKEISYDSGTYHSNVAAGIPMKFMVPIKVQGEMIRLRMRVRLRNDDGNITDGGYIPSTGSPPKISALTFRTKVVGRDRKK